MSYYLKDFVNNKNLKLEINRFERLILIHPNYKPNFSNHSKIYFTLPSLLDSINMNDFIILENTELRQHKVDVKKYSGVKISTEFKFKYYLKYRL